MPRGAGERAAAGDIRRGDRSAHHCRKCRAAAHCDDVVLPVSYGFSVDYRMVTITPAAPLAAGTLAVTNFGVRDLAGNFIANTGTANFVTQ